MGQWLGLSSQRPADAPTRSVETTSIVEGKKSSKRPKRPRTQDSLAYYSRSNLGDDFGALGANNVIRSLLSAPSVKCVSVGEEVVSTYGAHYHLYGTESPEESHGTALAWDLTVSPIDSMAAMRLCRVANSCRKQCAFLVTSHNGDEVQGLALRYAPTI